MQSQAAIVAGAIRDIPGITNLQIEQQVLVPQVEPLLIGTEESISATPLFSRVVQHPAGIPMQC